MKKAFLFFILSFIFSLSLNAQEIRGQVFNHSGETVSYANVILQAKSDSSFISGTITDNDGRFILSYITKLPMVECIIKISCIGYRDIYLTACLDMGRIELAEDTHNLDEVVVSKKRPIIQMSQGKMRVNVQNTILAHTGDAIHILSMLPFISRTGEGISVFGRGIPLVYIDNLKINDLRELEKLSSDEVNNVEINLHPSVSYENNVKAVVRIITIRKDEGFSVSCTAQGNQTKHFNYSNLGKLNYRFKQWDLFCGLDYKNSHKENHTENSFFFHHNDNAINIDQSLCNNIHNKLFNAYVGLNFSNKGKNDFGVKYHFSCKPSCEDNLSGNSVCAENNSMIESEYIKLFDANEKTNHTLNTYYMTSWKKDCRFALNIDYLRGKSVSQYESFLTKKKNVDTENKSNYHLYTGKAELFTPLWNGELHYGIEFSYTNNTYSYHAEQTINTVLNESKDENRQKLWGIFVSQSKSLGDFSIEAGGRIEISNYEYFHDTKLNEEVSKDYKKLLPYLQIDYDKNDISMSLSYKNSIHRPSYGQLNGSTVYVDKYTYQKGNPLLLSAYDYILDYVFSCKDLMVNITHTWYKNSLMKVTQKIEETSAILFTTENVSHYKEWGATISYSPKIKFWRPKAEISLFKQILSNNEKSYNTPYFSYELDNIFKLSKHINLSLNMWGASAGNLYLSYFKPSFRTDIGVNSYLLHNKLSIWFKVSDLFDTDKEQWISNINNILFSKNKKLCTRGFMVQLSYSFNPQRSNYKGIVTSSEIIRF